MDELNIVRRRLSVSQISLPEKKIIERSHDQLLPQSGKFINTLDEKIISSSTYQINKSRRRFSFSGDLSPKKERSFSNKCVQQLGDKIDEKQLEKEQSIAFACKKGLKPEAPNQDDFLVLMHNNLIILGVFDGHGQQGHDVSDYVTKKLPSTLIHQIDEGKDYNQSLKMSFVETHDELMNDVEILFDCSLSGTTATVCIIDKEKKEIWSACCGDSRAILGTKSSKGIDLTKDHSPNLPEEKRRIEESGGEVKKNPGDIPYRLYVRGQGYPGLAMSRAIGDFIGQTVGLTCEPEVFCHKIEVNDEFIVVCSDGVWEFLKTNEVAELIQKNGKQKIKESCEVISKKSWDWWVKEEEDVVDDITIIIAQLK